jgi:DNA polymerase III sliding clamp (beta) subunit (PCNA family)
MLLIQSERNALLASLSAVVGVVERRHTLPILSNLLLERKAGTLTVLATDLELQVSTRLQNAEAGEDFASPSQHANYSTSCGRCLIPPRSSSTPKTARLW